MRRVESISVVWPPEPRRIRRWAFRLRFWLCWTLDASAGVGADVDVNVVWVRDLDLDLDVGFGRVRIR